MVKVSLHAGRKDCQGVMRGAPPWLSRFHTPCHLTSPWWQWRKIITVVCIIVTAWERNSFLSACILYSLFLRKRFQVFLTGDDVIPLKEHVPVYYICHKWVVIAISCYGRTHHIQSNQPNMPHYVQQHIFWPWTLIPVLFMTFVQPCKPASNSCKQLAPRLAIFLCSLDDNLVKKLTSKQPALLYVIQKNHVATALSIPEVQESGPNL